MENYRIIKKIGEGSFSEVLKARRDGLLNHGHDYVAIKCVKQDTASGAFASLQSLKSNSCHSLLAFENREVFALRLLKPHPNVIQLKDVFVDASTSRVCIVTELMEMNLYEFLQLSNGRGVDEHLVKLLTWQALQGLAHVHNSGFFHRDIKPENMLINKKTMELKLADFGSCRQTSSRPPYTEYISTRWYRAPECLLTIGQYSKEMDIWSIGCIMFELLTSRPLFPGKNETQQLQYIQKIIGPPPFGIFRRMVNADLTGGASLSSTFPPMRLQQPTVPLESLLPGVSWECLELMKSMLLYSPAARVTACASLAHSWFKSIRASKVPLAMLVNQNLTTAKDFECMILGKETTDTRESPSSPSPCTPLVRSQTGEKTKALRRQKTKECRNEEKTRFEENKTLNSDEDPLPCHYADYPDEKNRGTTFDESTSEATTASALPTLHSTIPSSLDSTTDSIRQDDDTIDHQSATTGKEIVHPNGLRLTMSNSIDVDPKRLDRHNNHDENPQKHQEQSISFLSQKDDRQHQNYRDLGKEKAENRYQPQSSSKSRLRETMRFFRGRKAT